MKSFVLAAILSPLLVASASGQKHLMLDTRVIESTENAELVLGAVEKDAANPLFRADRPWENSLNNLYPNVLYDGEEQLYKLWYNCVLADEDAIAKMDEPSTAYDVGWYFLYATSRDGRKWISGILARDDSSRRKDGHCLSTRRTSWLVRNR